MSSESSTSASELALFDRQTLEPEELVNNLTIFNAFKIFKKFKTVVGVLLMDQKGCIVKSNLNDQSSGMYCYVSKQILEKSRQLIGRGSDEANKLKSIVVRSCTQEIIICPLEEQDLVLIIAQNPVDQSNRS